MGLTPRRADRIRPGVKDPSKRRAYVQEAERAKKLGGRTVSGSGSRAEKGDVRVPGVLRLEAKCTRKKSFSVNRDMLNKIEDAAASADEIAAMHIEFLDANGNKEKGVYVLPETDMDELLRRLVDANNRTDS